VALSLSEQGIPRTGTIGAEIFTEWKDDIRAIAGCENVVAKIGGLAMPPNGFDWHTRDTPATSDELVAAQRDYYLHAIDCFGPDRCMFESNFPVDKMSLSYHTYWNAMKKIASAFTDEEQDQMFSGTASRVYRL
jgi:L-fuconolactonase